MHIAVHKRCKYKTTKPSKKSSLASKEIPSIMVDFHGFTKEEALSKLDDCLPEWTHIAMQGQYPWVILVKIVCGGGNQILAEAVKNWIQCNKHVASAPKSIYK